MYILIDTVQGISGEHAMIIAAAASPFLQFALMQVVRQEAHVYVCIILDSRI